MSTKIKFLTPHRLSETLPVLDLGFFRSKGPCYDPAKALGEGWKGTILDVLRDDGIPAKDRIWAAACLGAMPENLQRLCAVAAVLNTPGCYDALGDERSRNALLVAEKYAHGMANDGELDAARGAARGAARFAADAPRFAAWGAAWGAAWDAMPQIFAAAIRENLKSAHYE